MRIDTKGGPTNTDSLNSVSSRLLTIKQAAERLGCTPANVYCLRASGQLPFVSIGLRKGFRIDPLDIDQFIARRKELRVAAPVKVPRPRLKHIRLS